MTIPEEEARARAYRDEQARRAAADVALDLALLAPDDAAAAVREAWAPLTRAGVIARPPAARAGRYDDDRDVV